MSYINIDSARELAAPIIAAAEKLGLTVNVIGQDDPLPHDDTDLLDVQYGGNGVITVRETVDFNSYLSPDPDTMLAQSIAHEVGHWLYASEDARTIVDYGLGDDYASGNIDMMSCAHALRFYCETVGWEYAEDCRPQFGVEDDDLWDQEVEYIRTAEHLPTGIMG